MEQEIEIEFKVLLSKEKFNQILNSLNFPAKPFTQINYYFETSDLKLKKYHSALRIRKKNSNYIVTLKEPHPQGILETHDRISESEFNDAINHNHLVAPNCFKQLDKMNIKIDEISYMGSLKTERYEYTDNDLIYVLDKSFYNQQIDYELEIEAPSKNIGLAKFNELIAKFNIEEVPPITKIERFFNSL
ncbi:MAG TPA: CYTH domain-containing protein [Pseudogracilibacillus sp.]|nr:CYTH domain-containing protein [Pseudogracilibacillus sp.]